MMGASQESRPFDAPGRTQEMLFALFRGPVRSSVGDVEELIYCV